ncbi:MAG: magnesium and cobalt transport protein CorA [Candidatus Magasanikbacteria bacterium RIFCSPHIGHO2_02_FULL_47_14]|uniref:Magnesium transport protein CorA n=1 Tax=Candidatus Magasanikbacteria bacterium RIFCSPHIGHO2_02_FULL_47_14 TaxID=1798680 RepID=A0A1F6LZA7_9BACT|nr:MAG: magnesium and cobalt transport protein CorA [Candidatus Magasanikbacteria bacterium RIFCSPHIGHO2_02_FULL_47_14]
MSKDSSTRTSHNAITIIDYDAHKLVEKQTDSLSECIYYKDTPSVTWINIDNVPPVTFLEELKLGFNLHPVVIDDILNINQRPKIEILDDYISIIFKMMIVKEQGKKIVSEQVSLVISDKFILTFQQGIRGDTFERVRELLRKQGTRIRTLGTDYLAYELIDSVVQNYFKILENLSERIEFLEKEVVKTPTPKVLNSIYQLKREVLQVRRSVWPLREVVNIMERGESPLVKKGTRIYLRDIYERLIQVIDGLETYRDILSGLLDVYLSVSSNRTNTIMKVLTIITTIFMPLSFLTGFYGMNFVHLPGLVSPYGPLYITAVMFFVLLVMLFYFKKRKWL